MKKLFTVFLLFLSTFGLSQSNVTCTLLPFSSAELSQQGRGHFKWNGTDQFVYPTPDYDAYFRFAWGDLQNLTTGVYNYHYLDSLIQDAVNRGQKFSFGIMGFYPGAPTSTQPGAAGPRSLTVGGFGLSYPMYVHTGMQSDTYQDKGITSGNNPPIFAAAWYPNYNSHFFEQSYDSLLQGTINHIKATTYSGINGWKVVEYVEMRWYGSTGEWTAFNINTATETSPNNNPGGISPFPVPANLVAADTTILGFCNRMIAMAPDKRIVLTTNGLTGEGLFDFSVRDTVAVLIMNMRNNVGLFGIRRDCFAQTDTYVLQFYEDNTTIYGGVNFANFFDSAYYYRPWIQEPCSGSTSLPPGSGTSPAYPDAPNQARKYHIADLANGNAVLTGTSAQQTQGMDSLMLASKISGYRVALDSANVDTSITIGAQFHIKITYGNTGVAPPYDHWIPTFQLRSGSTVLATFTSKTDHYMFEPGNVTIIDTFTMNGVSAGIDSLYLVTQDTTNYWAPFIYTNTAPVRNFDGSYLLHQVAILAQTGCHSPACLPNRKYSHRKNP